MEEEMKRPARGIDPAGLGERAIPEEPRFGRYTKGTSSEAQDAHWSTENGHYVPAYVNGLNAHDAFQFLYLKVPPQNLIVSPFLPSKGVVMLYAPRGIGKTHVALAIAVAAASGTAFLRWKGSHQWRVVYIDGEMPATLMQERFSRHIKSNEIEFPPENLRFVLADLEPDGLPDLGDPNSQPFYDGVIRDADLIVIDNLSTICRSCRENEADSWGPVQEWLLQRRREGKSVLVVHHSGVRHQRQ